MELNPLIDRMVDRFLTWELPESVHVDQCATMQGITRRTGTNLLSAIEARAMLQHVVGDLTNHDFMLMCMSLRRGIIEPALREENQPNTLTDFGALGIDIMRRWLIEFEAIFEAHVESTKDQRAV